MDIELYLWVKWIHVLSATVLFGTGIGSAFYMLFACLSRNVAFIAATSRLVVRADWWFTTPTAILQPASGWYLIAMAKIPPGSSWVAGSLLLYAIAIACWLPVLRLQVLMRNLAEAACQAQQAELPAPFWDYLVRWVVLGCIAFIAFLGIFYLMVVKPA